MGITTKNGDGGMSSLIKTKNVPKGDERFHLLGTIDELTSHLGLIKAGVSEPEIKKQLASVQDTLITVMAGIAEPHNVKYRLSEVKTEELEQEMQRLNGLFTMPQGWVLPGGNVISAQTDIARTVARRCERHLSEVTVKYGSDRNVKQYLNRMSDYLFTLARYLETVPETAVRGSATEEVQPSATVLKHNLTVPREEQMEVSNDRIIQEVLKRMGRKDRITLDFAKKLIEKVEDYSREKGMNAVIAVCGPDGNPIAVHVMDGAFLVSFDVAVKKAYTAAAVKMSTMELGKLIVPGGTFQGLDKMEGDKMVFFGGGVPLFDGEHMIGALGVSGGTGEQDDQLAQHGLSELKEILN